MPCRWQRPNSPRELDKAFLKRRSKQSGFNLKLLANEADLAHGYVRSIMSGGIQRPPAAKLVKLAEPLGMEPERLLALTDQLGASIETPSSDQAALVTALNRNSNMIEALVVLLARREGITLPDLAEAEASIIDQIASTIGPAAATEAIQRDRSPEPGASQPLDRKRLSPVGAKP